MIQVVPFINKTPLRVCFEMSSGSGVTEIEQNQTILCLKCKSLNIKLLFIKLLYKINSTFAIELIFAVNGSLACVILFLTISNFINIKNKKVATTKQNFYSNSRALPLKSQQSCHSSQFIAVSQTSHKLLL